MPKLTALKQHIALTSFSDVHQICYPALGKLKVCIMNLIRVTADGKKVSYHCNNPAWLEHYLKNQYPKVGYFEQHAVSEQQMLWTALTDDDPIVIFSRELFNIRHGITIKRNWSGGTDYFNFGTENYDPNAQQYLLNSIVALNHFIDNFYDKAARLLHRGNNAAFELNDFKGEVATLDTGPKRLYLGPDFNYQHLTERELLALSGLIKGHSAPDIALQLSISKRTVEKHVENIKQKLCCKTQCQLGYVVAKLGIEQPLMK